MSRGEEKGEEKEGGGYGSVRYDGHGRDESKCAEEKEGKEDGRRSPQAAHPWLAGTMVQRDIDGMWFPARILSIGTNAVGELSYDIEYLDDGNTEHTVPSYELRIATAANSDEPPPSLPAPLPLPLEGLLGYAQEDTSAPAKTPRAIVHTQNDDTAAATVFVVDGSQSSVPRGGGVRSIRFLRQSTRS
mmetsp:Transcript_32041/g.55128  ORF Transcript_32041/g.55128 Transcript_32041/m.55128 type:complete len:188 (-) Transcript_32041:107-670(-)